jgi:twitching motility protein PilT
MRVNQREIGGRHAQFASAPETRLAKDPDVILVGEMRDLETISTAITAAETGHLVFATLHTQDAPQTIDRSSTSSLRTSSSRFGCNSRPRSRES